MSKTFAVLEDSSINAAIIDGLKRALKNDLKASLMETAEKEVDDVVDRISKRFELRLFENNDFLKDSKEINLTWLLKKETEK